MAGERRWSDRAARPSGGAVTIIAAIGVSVAWTNVLHWVNGWTWLTPW